MTSSGCCVAWKAAVPCEIVGLRMPGRGIHHVDLAVSDVDRSLAFYMDRLGPLGLGEEERYPTYRGIEEVVYVSFGDELLGLRPADGGTHRYYDVGLEHLAFAPEQNFGGGTTR